MIYQVFGIIITMVAAPFILGMIIARASDVRYEDTCASVAFFYVMGHVMMWAMFQLVSVPLILAKSTLKVVVLLWGAGLLIVTGVMLWRIYKKREIKHDKKTCNMQQDESKAAMIFSVVLAVAIVGYQCYKYVRYMHLDEDDSRFVVNAVDAYDTGNMYLMHPGTGVYVGNWIGEMVKDVSSPWSIYIAALAKIVRIHPTIFAHSVYPAFLLIAGYAAYYLIGTLIFQENRTKSFLFVAIAATINMTFGQSVFNQSYFSMVRIWQGKAVVAGVMIPFLTYLLWRLYRTPKPVDGYLLLLPSAMAMCLMSGMGIFFSGIMIGIYGAWSCLMTKSVRRLPLVLLACLPTIVYGLSYVFVR